MSERPNLLVVCGRNKKRSRTAEHLFKNDDRFAIRSAGLSPKSGRKLTEQDLTWADLVLVMESDQRRKIKDLYGHVDLPRVEVLYIEDVYEFMNEELVQMLQDRINRFLNSAFALLSSHRLINCFLAFCSKPEKDSPAININKRMKVWQLM